MEYKAGDKIYFVEEKAFEDHINEFNKTAEESECIFREYGDSCLTLFVVEVMEKLVEEFKYCIEHYVNAGFLTKWYWERRLNKVKAKTEQLIEDVNKLKEETKEMLNK